MVSIKGSKKARVNRQIRIPEIRLIDAEGEQVGVIATEEALRQAEEANLDLVEISPTAKPPVCRIMDYGKYLFEQKKKQTSQKKSQKQVQIKEIKFRPTTDIGDYNIKLRKIAEFLEAGNKVKVTVRFRGREMMFQNLGVKLVERLERDLTEIATVEQQSKVEGRQMLTVFAPRK